MLVAVVLAIIAFLALAFRGLGFLAWVAAAGIVLELGDRMDDLPAAAPVASPAADAVRALMALGYPAAQADAAVRAAADSSGTLETAALVRRALTDLTRK